MTVYLFEIVAIFLFRLVFYKSIKINNTYIKKDTVYLISIFVLLGTVMALRDPSIGADTPVYFVIHQKIASAKSIKDALSVSRIGVAPVYVIYSFLLSIVFHNPQIIIIFNSLIISIGFFRVIKNNSNNYTFSCFLFLALTLYFEAMNGTRQFVAIAIAINAFVILKKDITNIKAWIVFATAILIHMTSLVFLIGIIGAYLIRKNNRFSVIIEKSALISASIVIGLRFIVELVVRFVPYFEQYLNGTNNAQFFKNNGSGRIIILYCLLLAIIIFTTYEIIKNKDTKNRIDYSIYPSVIFCVLVGIAFSKNILLNRTLWGLMCIFIWFIPNSYELAIHNVLRRKIVSITTGTLLLIYCIIHLIEDKSGIIPYVVFWSN